MAARTLLGISPGTRIVGLAVIRKGELVEWSVKTFKEKWSKDKERAILAAIERLCRDYGVEAVSVKKVDPSRSSPELDRLQVAITALADRMQIAAVQFSLSDLDYGVRTGTKQTKGSLSEHVASRHPEFKDEYQRERGNRREYYTKMFEAIAMAERGREP
jgi:RNase H-fold protein (predicted Holliday junction resolvase)